MNKLDYVRVFYAKGDSYDDVWIENVSRTYYVKENDTYNVEMSADTKFSLFSFPLRHIIYLMEAYTEEEAK